MANLIACAVTRAGVPLPPAATTARSDSGPDGPPAAAFTRNVTVAELDHPAATCTRPSPTADLLLEHHLEHPHGR